MRPTGRPEGEYRNAQHEGGPGKATAAIALGMTSFDPDPTWTKAEQQGGPVS